jgi:hypothetical protein
VAAIGERHHAGKAHEHHPAPDPHDQGVVIDPHGVRGARILPIDRVAEHDIEIAQRPAVDAGL